MSPLKAIACIAAMWALAGCVQNPKPEIRFTDRACTIPDITPYPGNVSAITPPQARVWAAGVTAGLATLCPKEPKP